MDEDIINQKDLFNSKIINLIEKLQDKSNPYKVQELKVKLESVFQNINKIVEQQYLLEKLLYECLESNGENLNDKQILVSKYTSAKSYKLTSDNHVSLLTLEPSIYNYSKLNDNVLNSTVRKKLMKTQIKNSINNIFKSNFKSKIQSIEVSEFDKYIAFLN